MFDREFRSSPEIPTGVAMLRSLVEKVETGLLTAKLDDDRFEISGLADCASEDAAAEVAKTVEALVAFGKAHLHATMIEAENSRNRIPRERGIHARSVLRMPPLVIKMGDQLLSSAQVRANGKQATLVASCDAEMAPLVASLTPAFGQAREAAMRTVSMNNLKQISLAMSMYESDHGHFPPAVLYGPDGRTPHSWRVALLPYFTPKVHEQYRFDEPWDSEHNMTLLDKMPQVYRAPKDARDSTKASCFVLTGPDTVFSGKEGTKARDITDGLAATLLVIGAKRDIPWTKPVDIPYVADKPLPKLGGWFTSAGGRDVFNAAYCDGHVETLLVFKGNENAIRDKITPTGEESAPAHDAAVLKATPAPAPSLGR